MLIEVNNAVVLVKTACLAKMGSNGVKKWTFSTISRKVFICFLSDVSCLFLILSVHSNSRSIFVFDSRISVKTLRLVMSVSIPTSSVSMFQFSIFIIRWVQFKFHLFSHFFILILKIMSAKNGF